jgi:hypothetical protein
MSVYWDNPNLGDTAEHVEGLGGLLDRQHGEGQVTRLPHVDFLVDASHNGGMADAYNMQEAGDKIADIATHLTAQRSGLAPRARGVAGQMHEATFGSREMYHERMNDAIDALHPLVQDVLNEHTGSHPDEWSGDENGVFGP